MNQITVVISILFVLISSVNCINSIFDHKLYENVLNPDLCREQLDYIVKDLRVRNQFIDAGIRTPRGISQGNVVDLGNYHQCLSIIEDVESSVVEGKYCTVRIPLSKIKQKQFIMPNLQTIQDEKQFPYVEFPWMEINSNTTQITDELYLQMHFNNFIKAGIESTLGFPQKESRSIEPEFQLAVCIPKSCTAREAMDKMIFNLTAAGLEYYEESCRLPNDKLWVAVDYIAIVIFSLIGLLTILSTTYEIIKISKRTNDGENTKDIYKCFSIYSNTKTLTTCHVKKKSFSFVAGLKAITIMWIIAAHTHILHFTGVQANPSDMVEWVISPYAIWITSSHFAIDTLALLTGTFAVYSIIGVADRAKKMFKRVPRYFWLRFRRVLPPLGVIVLLQASLLNHITDGPRWEYVARNVETCRKNWWLTMIQFQTNFKSEDMCLNHAWFLGAESQFFIQSPMIMMGLLSKNLRVHKICLCLNIIIGLVISSIFNTIRQMPSSPFATMRADELAYYFSNYYISGICRGAPFFVGMLVGYLLLKFPVRPMMEKTVVISLWLLTAAISIITISINYPIVQPEWNNQTLDTMLNILMRYFWSAGLGWIFFACARGYGGCIYWFLSFKCWKVLGRMSITMFIVHVPLMHVIISSAIAPVYFSPSSAILRFITNYSLTAIVSFIIMVLVERPCSALSKCLMPEDKLPRLTHLTHKSLVKKDPSMIIVVNTEKYLTCCF